MNEPLATAALPPPPDPPQDRHGRPLPPATAELLIQLQVLLVYARHLIDTLAWQANRGVALIAQCFGSAQAGLVLTHLASGILRAIALERVLLAQAAGQPPALPRQPRKRRLQPLHPDAPQPAGRQPSAPPPAPTQFPVLPTLRQLEAAIRRRPADRAVEAICHDLGLAFSLCEARFGNALRDMIAAYRGNLAKIFQQFPGRAAAVAAAPEPNVLFDCPPQKPDAIRYIVGCFIGARQLVCGFPFTAPPVTAATAGAQPP